MCFLNKPHLSEIHAKRVSTKQGLTVLFRFALGQQMHCFIRFYILTYTYMHTKIAANKHISSGYNLWHMENRAPTKQPPQSNNDVST